MTWLPEFGYSNMVKVDHPVNELEIGRRKIVLDDFWLVTNQKLGFADGHDVRIPGRKGFATV